MDTHHSTVNGKAKSFPVAGFGPDNPFNGATIISAYSRAQAIEDGYLIDVSEMAREAGIRYPTVITERVFSTVVYPPPCAVDAGESEDGRRWDVLHMLRLKIIQHPRPPDTNVVWFHVLATDAKGAKVKHCLWAKCGPGDDAEPVITIMTIGED